MTDWYSEGRATVIAMAAEAAGISTSKAASVYNKLENIGLIDYDTEKEIFYEMYENNS